MEQVRRMLQEQVDARSLPGAVVLRCRHGRSEIAAVGVQDLESRIPMSSQTLFHWDSSASR